jgi:hypothetical protein
MSTHRLYVIYCYMHQLDFNISNFTVCDLAILYVSSGVHKMTAWLQTIIIGH